MKAAVLGSNGYIGKHLAWHLNKVGANLDLYDIQTHGVLNFGTYHSLDVTDVNAVKSIDWNVDFVFYMCGLTGTLAAYDRYEEFIDVNEKGLLHLLQSMRSQGSNARIIFPSTRLVYKGKKDLPLNEDAEKEFKTIYALNKWTSEQLLQQYADYFNINHTIVRICVPYGSTLGDNYSFGTVGFFLSKALKKETIALYGDGSQKRTLTHVDDICEQILGLLGERESVNNTYNIAGETYSLLDLAKAISEKFKSTVSFVSWPEIDLKMESGDTIFDSRKLTSLLGYTNKYTIEKWLKNL